MSDIQAGDVVVRVPIGPDPLADRRCSNEGAPPLGTVCRVVKTLMFCDELGLVIAGWPSRHLTGAWHHDGFRKLNDGTDDAELIAQIKRCQPMKAPEHA